MEELISFLERIKDDHRIGPLHISLYAALLAARQYSSCSGLFPISREELMARAKIMGRNAYYRCLKELAEFGYITYVPERWPGKKSSVDLIIPKFCN